MMKKFYKNILNATHRIAFDSEISIEYLYNLIEFVSIYNNNFIEYKSYNNEDIIYIKPELNCLIEIRIEKYKSYSKQNIFVMYYPKGLKYKGRGMSIYHNIIQYDNGITDDNSIIVDTLIRESIETVLKDYLQEPIV